MSQRISIVSRVLGLVVIAAGLSSCGGGGPGLPSLRVANFNFAPGFGGVPLNAPLELTFTAPVDPATVHADSIRIFTTTTTTEQPDPGAPAQGEFVVNGNVVTFLPRIPEEPDLSDAGLRLGFTYAVQVPAAPDVLEPVRTIEGDPNVVPYEAFFTTMNTTILPAPGDITAEPNLNRLRQFFVDENIENGTDPCDRSTLPAADRDSPQVIDTVPNEGESGFGTITGIEPGFGTAFVRLDPIVVEFSEPIGPWRIRPQNIIIRNTNLGGETFDLFFFFRQDRDESILQITVFDADSAFDQASVPQGRYVLSFTDFTDLAGNPLVNSASCVADGTFALSFSTVVSPSQPADIRFAFEDEDQDGVVDVGGVELPGNDPNEFPDHLAPFVGGIAIDQPGVPAVPSPSLVTTSANPGNVGMWTGREMRYDNGFNPMDPDNPNPIPSSLRLRGGASRAATPILAPIAGRASGPSSGAGSQDGAVPSAEAGKVDFVLVGAGTASLFTGDLTTGPIVYHYNEFHLKEDGSGRPTLRAAQGSLFPMVILVEDLAEIWADIVVDGEDGEFGFNGVNDPDLGLSRNPGGQGGDGGPGGGRGGDGGAATVGGGVPDELDGQTGTVPFNILGSLDELSESVAGVADMATGGGGHYAAPTSPSTDPADDDNSSFGFSGGGGAGMGSDGSQGADFGTTSSAENDQGVGGKTYGDTTFTDPEILTAGGAGGGGGAAEDDNHIQPDGTGAPLLPDDQATSVDDGGGGAGGGGGFFGLACGGDIVLGFHDDNGTPADDTDDTNIYATIRAVGGRGGSTYATVVGDPPAVGDPSDPIGQGEAGGGGGGGGISLISGGDLVFTRAEIFAYGKRGGNSGTIEGGGRTDLGDQGGPGGGGLVYLADLDGIEPLSELVAPNAILLPDPLQAGLTPEQQQDRAEMTGTMIVNVGVYGDEPREALYGQTRIVSEFFDTLSNATSYDEVRVLSNAPRYPYSVGTPSQRTIRVFLDVTDPQSGFPDLSTELSDGTLIGPAGTTTEIGLHFDRTTGLPQASPQYDSRHLIPAAGPELGKRFARIRVVFDLSLVGTPSALLGSFAPPGAADIVIADDPSTGPLENTLGNIDTAPAGVPAVADIRVRFTPGG